MQRFDFAAFKGKSGVPGVNRIDLHAEEVSLPQDVEEQRAIARALQVADALLGALERLMAKKRDLKQAAMQQLLTGQTRLPGFTSEWEEKVLGDMSIFLKDRGVRKDDAQSGDLACIRYGEIYTQHHDWIRQFSSWISPAVAAKALPLVTGDALFAGSGETREDIAKCVAFVHEAAAHNGGDIIVLRSVGTGATFLGYLLNSPSINTQKAAQALGDAVVHIGGAALASIRVKLPPIGEQSTIAATLTDMDAEITALEQRLGKTRSLKQGTLQQLLTGRIRLVTPEGPRA